MAAVSKRDFNPAAADGFTQLNAPAIPPTVVPIASNTDLHAALERLSFNIHEGDKPTSYEHSFANGSGAPAYTDVPSPVSSVDSSCESLDNAASSPASPQSLEQELAVSSESETSVSAPRPGLLMTLRGDDASADAGVESRHQSRIVSSSDDDDDDDELNGYGGLDNRKLGSNNEEAEATSGETGGQDNDGEEDDYMVDELELSSSPSIYDESDINYELVYCLHTFRATQQGHADAYKGDAMIMLDDSNEYWWLVRMLKDSTIGFLPAENIEFPSERLARLNKHRNAERRDLSVDDPSSPARAASLRETLKRLRSKRERMPQTQQSFPPATGKNVSFAESVFYDAPDYYYSTDDGELGDEEDTDDDSSVELANDEDSDQEQPLDESLQAADLVTNAEILDSVPKLHESVIAADSPPMNTGVSSSEDEDVTLRDEIDILSPRHEDTPTVIQSTADSTSVFATEELSRGEPNSDATEETASQEVTPPIQITAVLSVPQAEAGVAPVQVDLLSEDENDDTIIHDTASPAEPATSARIIPSQQDHSSSQRNFPDSHRTSGEDSQVDIEDLLGAYNSQSSRPQTNGDSDYLADSFQHAPMNALPEPSNVVIVKESFESEPSTDSRNQLAVITEFPAAATPLMATDVNSPHNRPFWKSSGSPWSSRLALFKHKKGGPKHHAKPEPIHVEPSPLSSTPTSLSKEPSVKVRRKDSRGLLRTKSSIDQLSARYRKVSEGSASSGKTLENTLSSSSGSNIMFSMFRKKSAGNSTISLVSAGSVIAEEPSPTRSEKATNRVVIKAAIKPLIKEPEPIKNIFKPHMPPPSAQPIRPAKSSDALRPSSPEYLSTGVLSKTSHASVCSDNSTMIMQPFNDYESIDGHSPRDAMFGGQSLLMELKNDLRADRAEQTRPHSAGRTTAHGQQELKKSAGILESPMEAIAEIVQDDSPGRTRPVIVVGAKAQVIGVLEPQPEYAVSPAVPKSRPQKVRKALRPSPRPRKVIEQDLQELQRISNKLDDVLERLWISKRTAHHNTVA
ncbi:uncharacterized protein V1518DRAFT_304950 [Limtongia smithiae]|uniref:uncharacterized protein n=1 Tax=Limtongia smithiae TaxID=1125753 RepID=UPI0034CFB731